jgi:hypothetical protein
LSIEGRNVSCGINRQSAIGNRQLAMGNEHSE